MLEKRYDFRIIEDARNQMWEQSGAYAPKMGGDPFAVMMPPPNITGTLHLGHALDNTLPDILVRRARMQGKSALYQPGTDHASIAVHVVLEKQFSKEGKNRFDYGREAFMEKAWEWKAHSQGTIQSQLRRMGISCDWDNERFTMDDAYSKAVSKVFVELYERGLIYRGQRLVNWDPNMQTAVSDLEVRHKEVKGHLWHFKYPFADGVTYAGEDGISIATTRPETILADGAVAINPEDPRAKDLVGKFVIVPLVNRKIPIIADDYVDPEFGSGMVKITAAHDFNDFEVYKRHPDAGIPLINLLTPEAKMNENCPADYVGLDRLAARKKVIGDFKELGLFIQEVEHTHNVGHAERNEVVLEPYLTNQWFIKGEPLAEKVLHAIKTEQVQFVYDRDRRYMEHWLNNIQDWCISRQLWWGHRVPAWYKEEEVHVGEDSPGEGWQQDEDIFDTWFSSALWPFVTQGWPEKTDRVEQFYPGQVIMNGRDIVPFWDIRMLMLGLEFMEEVPFKAVYSHGLILDEKGQKMSKSKGNVVDPIALLDAYGADAVRLTMASIASAEDMRFSEQKVEQNRNFCTKLWNAARFMEMKGVELQTDDMPPALTHPVNQWLLSELQAVSTKLDEHFDAYEFNQVGYQLYHFTWGIFCDWYLELIKPILDGEDSAEKAETLYFSGWAFEKILRLMHPVIPFISEEIWQNQTGLTATDMLMTRSWPQAATWPTFAEAQSDITWLMTVVTSLRRVRSVGGVPVKSKVNVQVRDDEAVAKKLKEWLPFLHALANVDAIGQQTAAAQAGEMTAVAAGTELIIPLQGVVDLAGEQERIQREIAKQEGELGKIDKLLNNPGFVSRAPAEVVAENKAKKEAILADLELLKQVTVG